MFDLTGKTALVTGAQQGMGRADAIALARRGAQVAVTDLNEEKIQKVVDEIVDAGGTARGWVLDVTDEKQIDQVFNEAVDAFGGLDILVNNAGIYRPKPALELTHKDIEEVIHVNLNGQMMCAVRAAKEMCKNSWGRIINIASVASGQQGIGVAGGTHYTASKGGVLGMTEALAVEWAEHGITVNAIAPGAIKTPMLDEAGMDNEQLQGMISAVPLGRVGKPEEIASAVVFLASEEAGYITGAELVIDGGWLAG